MKVHCPRGASPDPHNWPPGQQQTLVMTTALGTLSLLSNDSKLLYSRTVAEQQFTMSELSLLLPLINTYPHYCPYEVMFANFNHQLFPNRATAVHQNRTI